MFKQATRGIVLTDVAISGKMMSVGKVEDCSEMEIVEPLLSSPQHEVRELFTVNKENHALLAA